MYSRKFNKILSFFFPDRCVLCKRVIHTDTVICQDCVEKLPLTHGKRVCKKCSRPIGENELLCRDCMIRSHYYTACFASAIYKGELRKSIWRFKFRNRPDYFRGYAKMIYSVLNKFEYIPRFDAIIGVPLSEKRYNERGYQQAKLIAESLAEMLSVPHLAKTLIKVKDTPAQSTLPYRERLKNLRGAFKIINPDDVKNKIILLVDDVYTTGTTVDEISKVLLRAGAKAVYVAVVAITDIN